MQLVQSDLEGEVLALQPAVEETAKSLYKSDQELMTRYLTDYSVYHAELAVRRWRELGEYLVTKYNDGYLQDKPGHATSVGYSESWLREVLRRRPDQFKLPIKKMAVPESELVD